MIKEKDMLLYKKQLRDLFIKCVTSDAAVDELFRDIFTPKEYEEFAVRLQIIKLLAAGHTQREISGILNAGVSTVGRGAHELFHKNGLFARIFLKK